MKRIACFSAWLAGTIAVPASELAFESHDFASPPPATPLFTTEPGKGSLHGAATTYSIGDPNPDEQYRLGPLVVVNEAFDVFSPGRVNQRARISYHAS